MRLKTVSSGDRWRTWAPARCGSPRPLRTSAGVETALATTSTTAGRPLPAAASRQSTTNRSTSNIAASLSSPALALCGRALMVDVPQPRRPHNAAAQARGTAGARDERGCCPSSAAPCSALQVAAFDLGPPHGLRMSDSDMRFIGHRYPRVVRIRPEGNAHVLEQRGAGVGVECRDGTGKRGCRELPWHECIHRGETHHQDRDRDAHLSEPGLEEEGPQDICIAEGAYRPQARCHLAAHVPCGRLCQGRNVRVVLNGTPHTEPKLSLRHQHPVHLPEGCEAVRKELQPLLTEHHIERGVCKGEGHCTPLLKFHSQVRREWERPCHREHAWVEIQARDCSTRVDAVSCKACDDARPT